MKEFEKACTTIVAAHWQRGNDKNNLLDAYQAFERLKEGGNLNFKTGKSKVLEKLRNFMFLFGISPFWLATYQEELFATLVNVEKNAELIMSIQSVFSQIKAKADMFQIQLEKSKKVKKYYPELEQQLIVFRADLSNRLLCIESYCREVVSTRLQLTQFSKHDSVEELYHTSTYLIKYYQELVISNIIDQIKHILKFSLTVGGLAGGTIGVAAGVSTAAIVAVGTGGAATFFTSGAAAPALVPAIVLGAGAGAVTGVAVGVGTSTATAGVLAMMSLAKVHSFIRDLPKGLDDVAKKFVKLDKQNEKSPPVELINNEPFLAKLMVFIVNLLYAYMSAYTLKTSQRRKPTFEKAIEIPSTIQGIADSFFKELKARLLILRVSLNIGKLLGGNVKKVYVESFSHLSEILHTEIKTFSIFLNLAGSKFGINEFGSGERMYEVLHSQMKLPTNILPGGIEVAELSVEQLLPRSRSCNHSLDLASASKQPEKEWGATKPFTHARLQHSTSAKRMVKNKIQWTQPQVKKQETKGKSTKMFGNLEKRQIPRVKRWPPVKTTEVVVSAAAIKNALDHSGKPKLPNMRPPRSPRASNVATSRQGGVSTRIQSTEKDTTKKQQEPKENKSTTSSSTTKPPSMRSRAQLFQTSPAATPVQKKLKTSGKVAERMRQFERK